jgi:pimeloyl-ACP methyl ester carboxylesterase
MFMNVLGTWLRGLFSAGLLVLGLVCVKEWRDHLPLHHVYQDASGSLQARTIDDFGERLREWDPGIDDPATHWLAGGILLLSFTFAGRFVSPLLWTRRERKDPLGFNPEVRRIPTTNGYHLRVDVHGPEDGPSLILVHGVGSDRTQWRETIEDLQDRFRIYAFDLLGHGRSDRVRDAAHTLDAAACDLDDVMASIDRDPVILAGHSMGGMIALTWCTRHPEKLSRLAGLVLVHTTPQDPFETMSPQSLHQALERPVHRPVLRMTVPLSGVVRLMNQLDYWNGTTHWTNHFSMFGGSESRQQLERSARLHATMDPAAVARFTRSMTAFDVRRRLASLRVPTLVVAAEKDPVTVPEASRFLAEHVPGARLVPLESTRHMGFMERRREFADAVLQFHDLARKREARSRKTDLNLSRSARSRA